MDLKFLSDIIARPLKQQVQNGILPTDLYIGKGVNPIEVALYISSIKITTTIVSKIWSDRKGGRSSPLLVIVVHRDEVAICGPIGEKPPVILIRDLSQAERLAREALTKVDRHSAIKFLSDALPSLSTDLPGISNQGLFALHALKKEISERCDKENASKYAKKIVNKKGVDLLGGLGYSIERIDNLTNLLRSGDKRTALAVMLQEGELEEAGAERFNKLSPISYALTKADLEQLPWVIFVQGNKVRLYSTQNIGVSKRGRTETYIECQTSLLAERDIHYLWLLFSADALSKEGSVSQLIEGSARFAGNLAEKLRERIYDFVIPNLSIGINKARNFTTIPTPQDIKLTYEMALIVLFRLLFVAYAEDRDLLPYRSNENYRRRSLKQKAQELLGAVSQNKSEPAGQHHWSEVYQVFQAVNKGNREWGIPAYAGTIFSDDKLISDAGYTLSKIKIDNKYFEPALVALLLTDTDENQLGPVDFRSLSVREFGTIYEGLLQSELSIADQDLAIDNLGHYLPANKSDLITIKKNEIYLHNRSGARKSTGSYYTPDFAVEHLLDGSLEPALDEHFNRLNKLEDVEAAEQFFDFRVADIAMGSGHFLVAAIDRIEKRFTQELQLRRLPGVIKELNDLRLSANSQLKEYYDQISIEDGQLLRRLIAKRCIYGVDLNTLAVQLVRLSIWIHSFVPGLPLSLVDHNIVHGNALVGIGNLDEIKNAFPKHEESLFSIDVESLLGTARESLLKIAKISDSTIKDIESGRSLLEQCQIAIKETKALCDLITAKNISNELLVKGFPFEDWERVKETIFESKAHQLAIECLKGLHVFHFPIAFPEVFIRDRAGFDVILGNPPWETIKVEEQKFWARHFPGMRALTPRNFELKKSELYLKRPDLVAKLATEVEESRKIRKAVLSGDFPGLNAAEPDLYKAFSWRFWKCISDDGGKAGLVLPRSVFNALGSQTFRTSLFEKADGLKITTLVNTGRWVFDMEPRYTVSLVNFSRVKKGTGLLYLAGPFSNKKTFDLNKLRFTKIEIADLLTWTPSCSIPIFPGDSSIDTFLKIRKSPRLNLTDGVTWKIQLGSEFTSSDKNKFDLISETCPKGYWPIYSGSSFDIWKPDTKTYHAWGNPKKLLPSLKTQICSYRKKELYAFCERPRILFRKVSRATDSRTMRVALIPPNIFSYESAQYIDLTLGDEKDQAYLLGILSSRILDWYIRRFVEANVNLYIVNPLPVPRPDRGSKLWKKVVSLSARLAAVDDRYSDWAKKVGVAFGPITDEIKTNLIYELEAVIAKLYGLNKKELINLYETFHEGWDFSTELNSVLKKLEEINE
ncbi:hypothetical protein MCEGE14_00607 [Burkholderiaceae bacterium]